MRHSLELGVNVNWKCDSSGLSGLHIAVMKNYGELLELLLSQPGVDVNITDDNINRTPLMEACWKGHENNLRRLCQVNGIKKASHSEDFLFLASFYFKLKGN